MDPTTTVKPTMFDNTRIAQRIPLNATAGITVKVNGEERVYLSMLLKDISRAGAFLMTHDPPPIGARGTIEIVLHFPLLTEIIGNDRTALQTGIEVVRVSPEGIGVRFDHEHAEMSLALQ